MLSWIKKLFAKKCVKTGESDTVYVGNLAYSITKSHLETAFSVYGTVTATRVIRDRQTGRSKGYGFVTFRKAEHAQKALAMSGHDLRGRQIRVSLAKDKSQMQDSDE